MASLTKVRLNAGGYTSWGRYFGNEPGTSIYMLDCEKLWPAHIRDGDTRWFFRARDRADALRQALPHLSDGEKLSGMKEATYGSCKWCHRPYDKPKGVK